MRIACHESFGQIFDGIGKQLILIFEVFVESGAMDHRFFADVHNGDFFKAVFGQQLQKSVFQKCSCANYSHIGFSIVASFVINIL